MSPLGFRSFFIGCYKYSGYIDYYMVKDIGSEVQWQCYIYIDHV